MTTGIIGVVGQYDHVKETLVSYTERLEMFFLANNILEVAGNSEEQIAARKAVSERKKAIFPSEVSPETYAVMSNLVAPAKPKDIVLEEIFKKMNSHFNPSPSEISESFHFGKRDQTAGESVNDYILVLKKLSIHSNFDQYLN